MVKKKDPGASQMEEMDKNAYKSSLAVTVMWSECTQENVIHPAQNLVSEKKQKSSIFLKQYVPQNLGPLAVSISWTLMMGTKKISETLIFNWTLTPLISREDFSSFIHRKTFKS
jgi:hypothetical protein